MFEKNLNEAAEYKLKTAKVDYERAVELSKPFYMLRPEIYLDGDQWCVLYGENIQEGVCAFGATPRQAVEAFNEAWDR